MIAEDSTGWVSWLYLLASLWGAWFSYNALTPRPRGVFLATWSFLSGWLAGDLAFHHIAWQALATLLFGALGAFEALPGQVGLAVTGASWLTLIWTQLRARRATRICEAALRDAFGETIGTAPPATSRSSESAGAAEFKRLALAIPTLPGDVERVKNIQFWRAAGIDLHLDVYRPRDASEACPVLLQIHGGAWMVDNKNHQARPLMHRLASNGWVCVSLDYRLSPHATFPEHVIDSKRGLAWVKQNIAQYSGDPNFIVVTGGSAGGHLSALTALTPNDPEYQPGFEDVDTTVQGCVPFYGVYDFTGVTEEHDGQKTVLEKYVMKGSRQEIPESYHRASPIRRVGDHAPPFFVIHGDCDTLVPLAQAHAFVRGLREKSAAPVAFAELPGAQHAFEVFHTPRTDAVVRAVERFVNTLHGRYREELQEAKEPSPTSHRPGLHDL